MLLNCGPVLFAGLNEHNSSPCVNSRVSANFKCIVCEHWTLIPGCVPVNLQHKEGAGKGMEEGRTPQEQNHSHAQTNSDKAVVALALLHLHPRHEPGACCTDPTPAFTCTGTAQQHSCWKPWEDDSNSVPYRVLTKISGLRNAQLRTASKYCPSGSYFRGKCRS